MGVSFSCITLTPIEPTLGLSIRKKLTPSSAFVANCPTLVDTFPKKIDPIISPLRQFYRFHRHFSSYSTSRFPAKTNLEATGVTGAVMSAVLTI